MAEGRSSLSNLVGVLIAQPPRRAPPIRGQESGWRRCLDVCRAETAAQIPANEPCVHVLRWPRKPHYGAMRTSASRWEEHERRHSPRMQHLERYQSFAGQIPFLDGPRPSLFACPFLADRWLA